VGLISLVMVLQAMVITTFTIWVVFPLLGRDYDAACISSGFIGMGLGATPVGIANVNALTSRYGPSPKAYLVIPFAWCVLHRYRQCHPGPVAAGLGVVWVMHSGRIIFT